MEKQKLGTNKYSLYVMIVSRCSTRPTRRTRLEHGELQNVLQLTRYMCVYKILFEVHVQQTPATYMYGLH